MKWVQPSRGCEVSIVRGGNERPKGLHARGFSQPPLGTSELAFQLRLLLKGPWQSREPATAGAQERRRRKHQAAMCRHAKMRSHCRFSTAKMNSKSDRRPAPESWNNNSDHTSCKKGCWDLYKSVAARPKHVGSSASLERALRESEKLNKEPACPIPTHHVATSD